MVFLPCTTTYKLYFCCFSSTMYIAYVILLCYCSFILTEGKDCYSKHNLNIEKLFYKICCVVINTPITIIIAIMINIAITIILAIVINIAIQTGFF